MSASRPSLRPRPTFNSRTRGRTTTQSPQEEGDDTSHESSSTTARTRARIGGGAVRPLRPGPRINIAARGRPGAVSTTTTEAPSDSEPSEEATTEEAEKESEAPPSRNPLDKLRNKNRVNVAQRAKTAASSPVQVRRINPLISRKKIGTTTEPSTEAPSSPVEEEEEEKEETEETEETQSTSTTTTEEPKGLNKLLAGRRRLAVRPPAPSSK